MKSICSDWEFVKSPSEGFFRGEPCPDASAARLPHTVAYSPLHYADPSDYTGIFGYRRVISPDPAAKRVFLRFDGAAHVMTLFVNGREVGSHYCGYTAYRAEITPFIKPGENLIAVRLDSTERNDVPPFGNVMDYLGYGGLYREAWLEEKAESLIGDVYVTADHEGDLSVSITADGEYGELRCAVWDCDTKLLSFGGKAAEYREKLEKGSFEAWSPEAPKLYLLKTELVSADGRIVDSRVDRFGFRTADFRADGLYLNGKKYFMRGLDRHQCWPYIGYAAPKSLQYEDARIMKEELSLNAVRTSHYPQSQSFIDACDELGLLVFTEIPGWQHIGDEAWKQRSIENVREMVLQYRNHPSIILWGVRINESADDDDFYRRTNAAAHELDSRPTSGVRCIRKSSLLEDVYAYNDFSHHGPNAGCRRKNDVTPDMGKALLISEHNGHMFPTKAFDNSVRRQENALRHARVLDAAYSSGEHAGCFGWCMFDYATHKDFGSGDRICYHGVMDAFRNPKLSAALYASQGEQTPVLEIGTTMDIGDYNASSLGEIYMFTNADEVELYKNGKFVTVFRPGKAGLPHPPIQVSDLVGELLKTEEGMTGRKERLVHESLLAAAKYGMDELPLKYKLKMAECVLFHHLKYEDGMRLYGQYIGNWGGEVNVWRFAAKKDGKVVAERTLTPSKDLHIEAKLSSSLLHEGDIYDVAALRLRVLDANGNQASYAQLAVKLELDGEAELIGPDIITLEGGMGGAFIKTAGRKGAARLTIKSPQTEPVSIDLTII